MKLHNMLMAEYKKQYAKNPRYDDVEYELDPAEQRTSDRDAWKWAPGNRGQGSRSDLEADHRREQITRNIAVAGFQRPPTSLSARD